MIKDQGSSNFFIGLFRQILKFVSVSGIGWILDFLTYTILGLLSSHLFYNNFISCLVGATFVFVVSPKIVFINKGELPKLVKYAIYISYQIMLIYFLSYVLVEINSVLVSILKSFLSCSIPYSYLMSKILITPLAMTCNFIVLKIIFEKLM